MLVSVCIPTYSRLNYLKLAVESIINQSFTDFEICVSQDPMIEGPDSKIRSWCEEQLLIYEFFKYNLNEKNLGLAGNWNKLVEMSQGEYIIIIGDDDLLAPNYLEILTKDLLKFNASVAFTNQYFINEYGDILENLTKENESLYKRNLLRSGLLKEPVATVLNNSVPMSSALISHKILKRFPFDNNSNTPEFEVFLKIASSGGTFLYNEAKLAYYRTHNDSATSNGLKIDKLLENIIKIDVPEKYQSLKFDFISSKIIPAINLCLINNNKRLASDFLYSVYYPRGNYFIRFIHQIFIYLPSGIFKFFFRFKNKSTI